MVRNVEGDLSERKEVVLVRQIVRVTRQNLFVEPGKCTDLLPLRRCGGGPNRGSPLFRRPVWLLRESVMWNRGRARSLMGDLGLVSKRDKLGVSR